ncbi:MAG: purine/pyrimidine permease [Spirochaetales bacterium]|nr:purine/pyrimidine permease [Spirochaetales bacterium]
MSDEAKKSEGWVIYPIGSKPKWGLSFLLGAQQFLTQFGSTVIIPIIIGGAMGLPVEELALLISTMFFCAGITTLIQQSPIGNRLPILQGGTFSFLGPMFAIVGMCAAEGFGYKIMIQQVCAAVMIASLFEIIIGYTGLMGLIKKAFSPIVIGPTIAMIGLALYGVGAPWMAGNWIISLSTFVAIVLFSQVFSRKSKVFALFPLLLAVILGWIMAWIGTVTGLIPEGNPANLKGGMELIGAAPIFWIKPIIPFKWGFPSFNAITVAGALGMLAGYVGSMIESVGDYYSCARISEAPVPTSKIISKGIGAEGIGCLVASIFQTCNGTTSYSENIGSIGLTRVASRRVIRCAGIILLILPFFGKFGMVLATMPQPIVGALFFTMFGLIAATGLSNLQFTNLNNARNLFIIGVGFFAGLTLPAHFGATSMVTGDPGSAAYVITNILQTIFTTGMAVTAFITMLLDNTLPGATREERGLTVWEAEATDEAWEKAEAEWAAIPEGQANWHGLK